MKFVPPAKDCPPIRVGLALDDRVMDAVHARGDNDQIQDAFEVNRQSPVGMMKESGGFERDEENKEHHRRDSEDRDSERKKSDREKHFAKMKARGRAYIEIQIGMVDIVKSPEEREHMIGPMPPPVGIIHEQNRGDERDPTWQLEPIEQTNMSILRPRGDRQRDWQHEKPDNRESRNGENAVPHESTNRAEMLMPERETPLQQKQRNENTAKQRSSDIIHQRKFRK